MASEEYETGQFLMETSDTPEVIIKDHATLPKGDYLQLKAFACAFICCKLSTLSVLQFRLYTWLLPMQANFISHACHLFVNLPVWIMLSRFDGQLLKTLKTDKCYLYLMLAGFLVTLEKQLCSQALTYVPSTIVFVSQSSGPFFAIILSRIVFKERLTVLKGIAFVITISSVLSMGFLNESTYDIGESTNLTLGIVLALIWSLIVAILIIVTKKISALNVNFVYLAFGLFGSLFTGISLLSTQSFQIPTCGVCGTVLVLCGLSSIISAVGFYYSCKFGDPGKQSALILGMNIIMSLIWEIAFFGRIPGSVEYISVSLALVGTGLNGFEKQVSNLLSKIITNLHS